MKNNIFNYVLLVAILAIQGFCYMGFYMGGRGLHGNILLDLGGVSLFIFALSIIHYNEVLKYLVPLGLWTTGFYILFQSNYSSISGAVLIFIASWLEYKLKSGPKKL